MTAVHNASPSTPISINTLVLLAYKRAGLLPVEATVASANVIPKLEHGRQLLDLMLDGLATEGFNARTTSFYELPIVAGQEAYTLPDSILDVYEDAMFVNEDSHPAHTSGELICKQVDTTTWHLLTNKGSSSNRPSLYAAFRHGATTQLKFWPVPTDAGTMRLKTVRLLGGNSDGTKNPDLQRYWYGALIWCLAYQIALDSSLPAEKVAMLQRNAEAEKAKCLAYNREHTPTVATLYFPTQWSN